MNKLLILIISIIYLNISLGFEFRQLVYTNQNCQNDPIVIYSSTQCSPNGYISITNKTFVSVGPTSDVLCKQANSPFTSSPSRLVQLNTCIKSANGINSYIYIANENGAPISVNGYCSTYSYYNDQSCDNLLVYSYKNATCIYGSATSQYRKLVCTNTDHSTYNCGDDSTCSASNCALSPAESGQIPDNKCPIKEVSISDTDTANSTSKSSSIKSTILLFSIITFIIFYI